MSILGWFGTAAFETVAGWSMEAQERTRKENISIPNNDSGLVVDANHKGKGLQLQFAVEDDGVFTMPWSATYRRALAE